MAEKMYEGMLSKEEISFLTFSDVAKLNEREKIIDTAILTSIIMSFLSIVALAAMLLWYSKFTIFLFIIISIPAIVLIIALLAHVKDYKKRIKAIKDRINIQENSQ